MEETLQHLIVNLGSALRTEMLEGEEHLVAPIVLLTEDVHEGSQGAVFYPKEVLNASVSAWNHMPQVVFHPEANGEPVSARSPKVIDSRKVGLIFNSGYADNLAAEAWFNVRKTNEVDATIIPDLKAGKKLEVSTGIKVTWDETPGEFKGKKYTKKVKTITPDHLAILPGKTGACSVAAGCGVGGEPLVVNDASFSQIEKAINSAFSNRYGYYGYVRDVYPDFFVYRGPEDKLYKKTYSITDGVATLGEEAVEVKWVTEYRTMSGEFVGNCKCKESTTVDKKTQIDTIINAGVGFEESDRAHLEKLDDAAIKSRVDKVDKIKKQAETQVTNATPVVPPVIPAPVVPTPQPLPAVMDRLKAEAPQLHEYLVRNLSRDEAEKGEKIKGILANPNNKFPEDFLKVQSYDFIANLAASMAVPAPASQTVNNGFPFPLFAGQGGAPVFVNNKITEQPLPVD